MFLLGRGSNQSACGKREGGREGGREVKGGKREGEREGEGQKEKRGAVVIMHVDQIIP